MCVGLNLDLLLPRVCKNLEVLPCCFWNLRARVFGLALGEGRLFFGAVSGRFFKYWLPVILWMSLIFSASTSLGRPDNTSLFVRPFLLWLYPKMPEKTIDRIHYALRKTAHFAEYAMLGLLLWRLFYFEPALAARRNQAFVAALLVSALYAASDEFHQSFVPGREAAARDVLLDTCGAGFGLAALWVGRRLGNKK
jgi:VanZ family protein